MESTESDHNHILGRFAPNRKIRDITKVAPRTVNLQWRQVVDATSVALLATPSATSVRPVTVTIADVTLSILADRGAHGWRVDSCVQANMNVL